MEIEIEQDVTDDADEDFAKTAGGSMNQQSGEGADSKKKSKDAKKNAPRDDGL